MSPAAAARAAVLVVVSAVASLITTMTPVRASTLATLELSAERVRPGEEVSFHGWYYNDSHPVFIRWDSPEGLVLAAVTPDTFGLVHNHFRSIAGTLTIPADATPGTHQLVATQDFAPPARITWGVPARAQIQVGEGSTGPERRDSSRGTPRPATVTSRGIPGIVPLLASGAVGAALATVLVALTFLVRRSKASQ